MSKIYIYCTLVIILGSCYQSAQAQEEKTSKETWYVWIDTEVTVDGSIVKVVSDKPVTITCCVKSAKYRRYVKNTAKWIKQHVETSYDGELSLMKIQDKELALTQVAAAKQYSGTVRVVKYNSSCK